MLDGGFTVADEFLIPTRIIISIFNVLKKDGVDIERLQLKHGLPVGISEDKYRQLEFRRLQALLVDAQWEMGGPVYGLRMAEVHCSTLFTKFVHLFLTTESLFSSLCFFEERLKSSRFPTYITLTKSGNDDKLMIHHRSQNPDKPMMLTVLMMGLFWKFCERVVGEFEYPATLRLGFPQDNPLSLYQEFFGHQCHIEFDCNEYSLTFSQYDFRKSNPIADIDLQHKIKNLLRGFEPEEVSNGSPELAHDWPLRVRGQIEKQLPQRNVSIDVVADMLHVSPRTLQRKLKLRGFTYSGILEECRKELALVNLNSGKPVAKVASDLGYSSVTTFRHAFQGWYGTTLSLTHWVTAENDESLADDD
ncbi:hypothetical protein BTA51_16570 [Hahella sp. CCB-MM4]|uniref:AraC family transcriptional regulator n=1 Tax=Hahella sp. (strain CCB-MM4) TaxID=1926491 RepID=UPI000B9A2712|nr:AraC family transcriptional regulator [Hahella sp. CCB-MM4]OZG72344.1 hypothetical protein BTA51_16570 [Hahella sp. CCB-MM4]